MENAQCIKFANLRRMVWPVENEELKKFLPMVFMFFLISFNYSMLRSIKYDFVVINIGIEALSLLKTYYVFAAVLIAMIIYAKLCNIMSNAKVFYTITSFFAGYFLLFATIIYPNLDMLHPDPEMIDSWAKSLPRFQWLIKIGGKWAFASFYIMAELWGSVMLILLFWQFANQITKTDEAKRFYPMFILLGNLGLILTVPVFSNSLGGAHNTVKNSGFEGVIFIIFLSTVLLMGIYAWMQKYVLTDPKFYQPDEVVGGKKKNKPKLSLIESFRVIFTSKYLGLIAMLVIAYGISIKFLEVIWKINLQKLYPTDQEYTAFMGLFQQWQGIGIILSIIIGSNILRFTSWRIAALFTPIMILITGAICIGFTIFDKAVGGYIDGLAISTLVFAVFIGIIKGAKYSLFNLTKEMAYIPISEELKTKGKAVIDVVLPQSGIIQSTFFIIFSGFSFKEDLPLLSIIFFIIVIVWIFSVNSLSKEYQKALT